jgi:hypothetical protein
MEAPLLKQKVVKICKNNTLNQTSKTYIVNTEVVARQERQRLEGLLLGFTRIGLKSRNKQKQGQNQSVLQMKSKKSTTRSKHNTKAMLAYHLRRWFKSRSFVVTKSTVNPPIQFCQFLLLLPTSCSFTQVDIELVFYLFVSNQCFFS